VEQYAGQKDDQKLDNNRSFFISPSLCCLFFTGKTKHMQQKKEHKESNLRQLEEVVKLNYVQGKKHAYFMRFIGNQYPLEFVRFMKKHREGKLRIDKDMLDDILPTAIEIVNDMHLQFRKFLVQPPNGEKEKEEFERLVDKLEEMILEQTRDN
jgi:hypothetical protein